MKNAIEVNGLTKSYRDFLLDGISFQVPSGFVTGFIGQNGAGKTTTLKLILGMALKTSGDVIILGRPSIDSSVKEDIGVLLETPCYQEDWTAIDIENALRPFYVRWSSEAYHKYLKDFSLNPNQKFKEMSRGMKIKLGMASILSHDAKILILDEPTAGLDPSARRELLQILREYMVKEDRGIFFSTHITSDLEKIADYIVYINNGKIIYSGTKDNLLESFCIVRGGPDDLQADKRSHILGLREYEAGFEGLIRVQDIGGFSRGVITEEAVIEDIMFYLGGCTNG